MQNLFRNDRRDGTGAVIDEFSNFRHARTLVNAQPAQKRNFTSSLRPTFHGDYRGKLKKPCEFNSSQPFTCKISLNIWTPGTTYNGVRCYRNLFFALAAFLWLPASAHCQLEALTGLEFLACETDSRCHDDSKSSSDNAGCCSVEKSQYPQAAQLRATLPSPHLFPVLFAWLRLPAPNALPAEFSGAILTTAPPELLPSRHFLFRTALPVRAPSPIS